MVSHLSTPVFHLSTPVGEGGIAVLELFGDSLDSLVDRVFVGAALPDEGRSRLGKLIDLGGETIDEVLVSRQPASSMWCGLPAWTISVHGGVWLQERAAHLLEELGLRRQDRQEILALAVESGALDAVQAAAFDLLVDAVTERAALFLAAQHQGELSGRLSAVLDAVEDLDPDDVSAVAALREELAALDNAGAAAFRLGHPLRLLIAGPPNAGKSTLFNRLVENERVVVSEREGTTRDFVREMIAIDDAPVELIDSAGLRAGAGDPVEADAIRRVRQREADALLLLRIPPWRPGPEDEALLERFEPPQRLIVGNFVDLEDAGDPALEESVDARISALRGDGLDELRRLIASRLIGAPVVVGDSRAVGDPAAPFTVRQREIVREARGMIEESTSPVALDEVRRLLIMVLRSSWP